MPNTAISAILAGLFSGSLFLVVAGLGLGFIFLFLPTLPLFVLGLSKKSDKMPLAVFVAVTGIFLVAGLPMALVFLLFLGLPAWYLSNRAIRWRIKDSAPEWFPIGRIMMNLTLCACVLLALVTLYYSLQGTSLPALLSENIRAAFADLKDEFGDVVETLAGELSFLMFPITLWLWALLLYAHAWLANRILMRKKLERRADFSVQVFTVPSWMLTLLAISALASLIGGESMSFLGKTTTLSLMLPYFFLGISVMHARSAQMPSRKIILFFVYFMVVSQFWPALILSGVGLWHQVKSLRATHVKNTIK